MLSISAVSGDRYRIGVCDNVMVSNICTISKELSFDACDIRGIMKPAIFAPNYRILYCISLQNESWRTRQSGCALKDTGSHAMRLR